MRFYDRMLVLAADLTRLGEIVLMPHAVKNGTEDDKKRLDPLHREKIRRSDRVMVVTDESGYIGESTSGEIAYSELVGVPFQIVSLSDERLESEKKGNTVG